MTSAAHVSPSSALERVSSLCGRRVRALLICASLMHLAACGGVSLEGARGSASGADARFAERAYPNREAIR